jgi:putative NADH-flavin reductase
MVGSHICRAAVRRECLVTSISRSGGQNQDARILDEKADIFEPEKYRELLRDAKAVIYSAGILLEGDYKSLAQGKFDPSKVIGLLQQSRHRNPLQADPKQPRGYDKINRDGGINADG